MPLMLDLRRDDPAPFVLEKTQRHALATRENRRRIPEVTGGLPRIFQAAS